MRRKIVLMLSYPSDEVGNELVSLDKLDDAGINPYSDLLTLEKYRELFGENKHPFTGVDYVQYYKEYIAMQQQSGNPSGAELYQLQLERFYFIISKNFFCYICFSRSSLFF